MKLKKLNIVRSSLLTFLNETKKQQNKSKLLCFLLTNNFFNIFFHLTKIIFSKFLFHFHFYYHYYYHYQKLKKLEESAFQTLKFLFLEVQTEPTNQVYIGDKRYLWRKKLADTLQGEIHLAEDTSSKKLVIIKIAIKECVKKKVSKQNQKVPEDFKNESRVHVQLTSYLQNDIRSGRMDENAMIGFVRCDNSLKDKKNYYLAMEYCKDGDLFNCVASYHRSLTAIGQMQEHQQQQQYQWIATVQIMFRQIAYGIGYMHDHHIVHQDLSLENVMIFDMEKLYVKIIDFGVAKNVEQEEAQGALVLKGRVGKTNYMSPECYNGKAYNPFANDIWCLGVMLFMMLIGAPPPIRDASLLPFILCGRLKDMLVEWKRIHLVNDAALDCLNRILTVEHKRIRMEELLNHPFVLPARKGVTTRHSFHSFDPSTTVSFNHNNNNNNDNNSDNNKDNNKDNNNNNNNNNNNINNNINNNNNDNTNSVLVQAQKFLQNWSRLDKSTLSKTELRQSLITLETLMNQLIFEHSQICSKFEGRVCATNSQKEDDNIHEVKHFCCSIDRYISLLTSALNEMKTLLSSQSVQHNSAVAHTGLLQSFKSILNSGITQLTSFLDSDS
ncbi:hypothetical protein RFI_21926 [Reticulomyxa filosa]|uniref:Protein kinase domain-containing protein n=1 Tax=Reticulomyxa filosa TaxID=46433 RepID=X6MNN1_RETFI|nr:hypothetical protein RFI_21926 [Reticulomyxa filosa]|eukprot:ETO15439.1 hypothetical protein RFI_21926 [Reticulomyxa filosa]